MTALQRRVQIEIDELLLESASPYQADVLARLVEEELARLMGGEELPAALLHARQAHARRYPGTSPVATSIAREIHQQLRAEGAL